MNLKRMLALVVSFVMLAIALAVPLCAGAVTLDEDDLTIKPGNTQFSSTEYSMAWLDKLIIRDDALSVTTARMVPKADYPYSTTYEEFVKDVNNYTILNALNEDALMDSFDVGLKAFYYVATAMGMTTDIDTMYTYVTKQGIRVPANLDADEKIELAAVYACLKYNALYVLFEKDVSFTKGTTLDESVAIILSEVGGFSIPSTVKSIGGLSAYFMKDYIDEFDEIPLTDNPDIDELFYWIRAVTASKQGYDVPIISYDQTTQTQRDYVDYAYYAAIFDTLYDIHINPLALVKADYEADVTSIPKLILTTMLDEKNVEYNENSECETLFDLACKNGYFDLDEEFYSDIFSYDLYVNKDCEKLWFTPFALADQLGGDNTYLKVRIGKKEISSAATTYAALSTSKETETVKVVVTYDDGADIAQEATYTFNIIKTEEQTTQEDSNSLVSKVEAAVKSAVPSDSDKANEIVDSIFSSVNSIVPSTTAQSTETTQYEISTYAQDEQSQTSQDETTASSSGDDGYDFNYLSELFSETYAVDDNTSHSSYLTAEAATTQSDNSIVEKTVTAIKENPEIVAAPTGVVTFGALAGYLFTKKKKPSSGEYDLNDDENNMSV